MLALEGVENFGDIAGPVLLDGALSDEDARKLGEDLGRQSNPLTADMTSPPLTTATITNALRDLDAVTRTKVMAAYVGAGGDAAKFNAAIDSLRARVPKWLMGLQTLSGAFCAYHGYKRNDSIGWAVGWFILGSVFFPITPVIALAQGYGKRKGA